MAQGRWLVFIDLDGTLLSSQLTVSPRDRAALRAAAAEAGAEIVLASGRPARSCLGLARDHIPTPRFVVASNGGAVVDCNDGTVLHTSVFRPGSVEAIARIVPSGLAMCVYHPLTWYAQSDDGCIHLERQRSRCKPTYVRSITDYSDSAIKLLIAGDPRAISHLRPRVNEIPDVYAFVSYPEYLEVMPATSDKGAAARAIETRLGGGHRFHRLAIGDGDGDLPLFAWADVSVAMGNAPPHVKSQATYTTTTNDDNGVARAIEAVVLRRQDMSIRRASSSSEPPAGQLTDHHLHA